MAENKDNLEFLVVYMDGSLMKKDGKQHTSYGVAGYYMGELVFEKQGALREQTKVFNAEMIGLSTVRETAKLFILNGNWTHQPTDMNHILCRQHCSTHTYIQRHTRKGPGAISCIQKPHR